MTDKAGQRLERSFERVERRLPDRAARVLRWLRQPSLRWLRIPSGLLLIAGGVLSFLPVLGVWMLPLGFLLLAQDVPFLKEPTARALLWIERRWARWRKRRGEAGA